MRIGVLGTVMIEGAGNLPSRDRRVLAALVLDAPDPVSPERLGDALWGGDLPASWRKVLQSVVSRLRRVLGSGAISFGPGGYRLDVPSEDVDVRRFEALVELAEQVIATDPSEADRHLDDARQLWRGEPYSDLGRWAHALGTIRRLEARRSILDELRVEVLLAGRRFDVAVAAANALLEEEPLDERRAALLATALYRAGRTVEALSVLRRVRRHLRTELGLEPSPGLVALEVAVLRHDPSLHSADPGVRSEPLRPHSRPVSGNLLGPLTRLFGRDTELAEIDATLRNERLVVLTGAGGVGKTRLALAAADRARPAFAAGIWLVELAANNEAADIASPLLSVFGFVPRDGLSARESVIEGIGDRQMLLVLDNCEHVLDAIAEFAVDALRRCIRLRILATSREAFGVDGEHVILVPPLRADTDAVDLFIDRARNSDPSFRADDRTLIEDICHRLDGIPLAIELAAARVRTLPLNDLAVRLGERLDILASRRHGSSDRHRTMRAALDWSYDLLDDDERIAFSRLSVFAGSFDLTAFEAVIGATFDRDPLDLLGALVDKSMVVADPNSRNPFRLLEPLRQYAGERLAARGETTDLARRHARYYADLGSQLAIALEGPGEIEAASRFDAARANLRAAFATAVVSNDADLAMRIVAPLAGYTNLHVWAEPWSWCQTALALSEAATHPLRAAVLVQASRGAWQLGDPGSALALADQAVVLADTNSATWRDAQISRATVLTFLGRLDEAEEAAAAAVETLGDAPDRASLQRTATMLLIRNLAGHPEPALARQLLSHAEVAGPSIHALALHTAAVIPEPEDRALALDRQRRAVELARAAGAVLIEGFALNALAALEAAVDPAAGAASQVKVMALYLSVGNGAHLRAFGRGIIVALVDCGSYEAAAVVDGATRTASAVLPGRAGAITEAINRARDELGPTYHTAASRGEHVTDDELVHYLQHVVTTLAGRTVSASASNDQNGHLTSEP